MSNHTSPLVASDHVSLHVVFHNYVFDDSKQDATITYEHSKRIIELLQNRTVLFADMSTTWEDMDGCVDQIMCHFM